MQTLTTAKVIAYNRDTHDFDATFDGDYIGSFRTMHEAENELNQHVLRLCEDGLIDQPLAALAEQALTAALADDPPPAPPVDDGPEDTWGGFRVPDADWGAYAHDDLDTCGCGAPSMMLLHGVHDALDIPLCGRCYAAYDTPALVPDDPPADDFSDVGPAYHAPGHCRNCGGPHVTQRCPEIWAALRADPDDGPPPPWDAPNAGRAVGRQWLRDRARFLDVLRGLDRDAWTVLAAAYCAWMNRGGCGIEVEHVILIWRKAVERDIALPPKAA